MQYEDGYITIQLQGIPSGMTKTLYKIYRKLLRKMAKQLDTNPGWSIDMRAIPRK